MPIAAIAVAIFINALWGGNPIAVKIGLEAFPPFYSAFLRFSIGAICVALWAFATGVRLWPDRSEWRAHVLLSLLFGIQIATMNIGIDMGSGAVSAVLISMYPLFAAVLSHLFGPGGRLTLLRSAGLAVAFGGAVAIVVRTDQSLVGLSVGLGELIVLVSAALLGGRLVFSANLLRRMDTARVVFWQMLIALPAFGAIGAARETIVWDRLGPEVVLGLLYQGVVIAGFGFVVNAALYRRYDPGVIAGFGFVGPVSGVLLGITLLGDPLTVNLVIGTAAVGCGLVLVTLRRGARPGTR